MRSVLLILVMLFLSSCFSDKSKWPYRMTPFFAECPYEEGTFVDEDYHRKVESGGCKHGYFKFFDRGEPNLSGDPVINFPEDQKDMILCLDFLQIENGYCGLGLVQ